MNINLCGRCYEEVDELFEANCESKPEYMGQYHCPDCGCMLVAGVPHFKLCKRCLERKHPEFDR